MFLLGYQGDFFVVFLARQKRWRVLGMLKIFDIFECHFESEIGRDVLAKN